MSDSLWPLGLQHTRLLCPWDFPGENTGVDSHSLVQGIFLTQGSNLGLLHCRQILYHLSHQGSRGMANGHVKGCSASLIVREMQIGTTGKYHFTLVSVAITEKSTDNKWWRGCREKGTLLHCWRECQLVQPLWKKLWRFLKKLRTSIWSSNPWVYPWEKTNSERFWHSSVHRRTT